MNNLNWFSMDFVSTSDRHTVLATVSRGKTNDGIYSHRPRIKCGVTKKGCVDK
jgi:hypothetical protein